MTRPDHEPTGLAIDGSQDLATRRRLAERLVDLATEPTGISESEHHIGDVPVSILEPVGASRGTIVHCHGGHSMCSRTSHRRFAGHLAVRTGWRVVLVGYNRTPEHAHTAAVDEVEAVVRNLLPGPLALCGESAGGGIALAATVHRDLGGALDALVLLSPWLDRGLSGASMVTNADRDMFVSRRGLEVLAAEVFGSADRTDPVVSPLFANLGGLPPTLVQVAGDEVLLDDSIRLATRAEQAGSTVRLEVFDDMQHAWHLAAGNLPAADDALDAIGAFLHSISLAGERGPRSV